MFKILLSAVYTLFFIHTFSAQENKENILRNFNHIEYYPDSTIRLAMNYRDFEPFGYCIEFDEFGAPILIGEYSNWRKSGVWLKSDGTIVNYTAKEVIVIPTNNDLIQLLHHRNFCLLYSNLTKRKYFTCY